MYAHAPPVPPPKPGSHETSRIGTPSLTSQTPHPAPLETHGPQHPPIADPGDQWLPEFLEDKSKQDLADILSSPALLSALTHAPQTIHPSLQASHAALRAALRDNLEQAARLRELEDRAGHERAGAQARLLTAHSLERAWRAKQAQLDAALAPFAPASLYQRLAAGVAEQEAVCRAMEESFLDAGGDAGAGASEREVGEWVRRYREAKKLYYLRQERKERWDEGRVGGWR